MRPRSPFISPSPAIELQVCPSVPAFLHGHWALNQVFLFLQQAFLPMEQLPSPQPHSLHQLFETIYSKQPRDIAITAMAKLTDEVVEAQQEEMTLSTGA